MMLSGVRHRLGTQLVGRRMNLLCFEEPEIEDIDNLKMNLSPERITRNLLQLFLFIANKSIASMNLPVLHFELILSLGFGFEGI